MAPVSQALEFLRRRACEAGEGARLPSVKALATEAGVSHYSLSRALDALRREGVLEVRQRSGTVVRRTGPVLRPSDSVHQELLPKWRRVALALSRRIRSSAPAGTGSLVLPKAVCAEFGLSYPTARKALDYLVRDGLLQPSGRGFSSPGGRNWAGMSVLCLTRRSRQASGASQWQTPRVFGVQLEQTCMSERIPIEYAFLEWRREGMGGTEGLGVRLAGMARRWPRAMAVVNTAGMQVDAAAALFGTIQQAHTPIVAVIFDPALDPARLPPYRLGVVQTGTFPYSGPVMADFLIERGYQDVVFMAYGAGYAWQTARLAGLRARLAERSGSAQLRVVAVDPPQDGEYGGPDLGALQKAWQSAGPSHVRVLRQLWGDARHARQEYLLRTALMPAISDLFRHGPPDVIVGANDSMAIACLDILRHRRVRVPQQCSVTGFDDSPEAFISGLTSYSHNWPSVAREVLRFGATCGEHTRGPVVLDVEGSVVERLTTK